MKNVHYGILTVLFCMMLPFSCASTGVYIPLNQGEEVIGSIQTNFYSMTYLGAGRISKSNQEQAYIELMKVAKNIYQGNIDIRNVTVSYVGINIEHGNDFTASGVVILNNSNVSTIGIGGAIRKASQSLINALPTNATIAVLSISSRDNEMALFVMDELEFQLVNSGNFTIVDRKTLDEIRDEQNYQMSGEVDDNSAISIGKILGASIVITGNISGSGSTERIVLKALDVETAEIVTMAREQIL
jgi:hypothetical protein